MEITEGHRGEDREYMLEIEEAILKEMNLQKSQFSMMKQCIHELQATVRSLDSELVFSKNRIKTLEREQYRMQQQQRRRSCGDETKLDADAPTESKEGGLRSKTSSKGPASSPLAQWLSTDCGFPQYVGCFVSNGYDRMEIVKEMSTAELKDIGVALKGHRFKIAKEIEKLRDRQHLQKPPQLQLELNPVGCSPVLHLLRGNSVPVALTPTAKGTASKYVVHSNQKVLSERNSRRHSHDDHLLRDFDIGRDAKVAANTVDHGNLSSNRTDSTSTASYTATATYSASLDSPKQHRQQQLQPQQLHSPLVEKFGTARECAQCRNHNVSTLWKCECSECER